MPYKTNWHPFSSFNKHFILNFTEFINALNKQEAESWLIPNNIIEWNNITQISFLDYIA